ncbi:hypothetical protein EV193_103357 [Herbihabitans rhizosphaerae]|uniref:Uncharacterized protein n=1 Tax=Herbihabitans rhizosphaerae TaxID=1872711 RepID=A0A4Q7KVJ2_9PSEU|nr:hypothetical protein EV193_103357 [Herbihabitans rhizosphaerae]
MGPETIDQLESDVRGLVRSYQQRPLETLLPKLASTQEELINLISEGRQRPDHARDLYLLAGVASGLLAKASHDVGSPDHALTQARAAYISAERAGHSGLIAWTRGLQALITYWAGDYAKSAHFAEQGFEHAEHSQGTVAVWLACSEARTHAALNHWDKVHEAIAKANDARDRVELDDLDALGGLCTFSRPRQLYYIADSLAWGGSEQAADTERYALEAIDAYNNADPDDRAFGDEAGTRCDLALARVANRDIEGGREAMTDVLELPPPMRISGIVHSVQNVRTALASIDDSAVDDFRAELEDFSAQRLAVPS